MKKTLHTSLFLLVLLATSYQLVAQSEGYSPHFLWYKLIDNATQLIQTPQQIVASSDGHLFSSNIFYSKERNQISSVFNFDVEDESEKVNYYGDDGQAANGNTNIAYQKLNPNGQLLWTIYTSRGDIGANTNALKPTPDGGFITVLMARDANPKSLDDRNTIRIVQADGSHYNIAIPSLFYGAGEDQSVAPKHRKMIPVLIKVNGKGKVEFHKLFEASHEPMPDAEFYSYGTSNGIYLYDTALDELGNIYLCGRLTTSITIDNKTYKAKNNVGWNGDPQKIVGDLFLIKLDKLGNVKSFLHEEGDPIVSSEIRRLRYQEGKLYMAGSAVGSSSQTAIRFLGKEFLPAEKKSILFGAVNIETMQLDWLSQIDIKSIPEHSKAFAFIDALAIGKENIYIGGRCSGGIYDKDSNLLFKQTTTRHRGYAIAINKQSGQFVPNGYTLLPEAGISNVLTVAVAGRRVVVGGYTLFSSAFYRVYDETLSEESMQTYEYVNKAATTFGGDVVRNMFVGNARNRNSAKLLTNKGYKEIKGLNWFNLIVAHKLPFPFISSSQEKLHIAKEGTKLEIYTAQLSSPIQVKLEGNGFTADLDKLPTEGGFLTLSFQHPPTDTPETKTGKLILTSGDETLEVLLTATTDAKRVITTSTKELNFGEVTTNQEKKLTLDVELKNITKPVSVSIVGDDASDFFVNATAIAPDESPFTLTVTYKPTSASAKVSTAKLSLSIDDYQVSVDLSGSVKPLSTYELSTPPAVLINTLGESVVVTSPQPAVIRIYSVSGTLLEERMHTGQTEFSLPSGLYILTFNKERYKLVVQN